MRARGDLRRPGARRRERGRVPDRSARQAPVGSRLGRYQAPSQRRRRLGRCGPYGLCRCGRGADCSGDRDRRVEGRRAAGARPGRVEIGADNHQRDGDGPRGAPAGTSIGGEDDEDAARVTDNDGQGVSDLRGRTRDQIRGGRGGRSALLRVLTPSHSHSPAAHHAARSAHRGRGIALPQNHLTRVRSSDRHAEWAVVVAAVDHHC